MNKYLSLDIQKYQIKIKKEIKMAIQETNCNNLFLLDLQKRIVKVLKTPEIKHINLLDGLRPR